MRDRKRHKMRIEVDGVELTVQVGDSVKIHRVVGRDRKRKIDITSTLVLELAPSAAALLVKELKRVAALQTARCTCDYRYGFSDHAEHCTSIYVAKCDGAIFDDD